MQCMGSKFIEKYGPPWIYIVWGPDLFSEGGGGRKKEVCMETLAAFPCVLGMSISGRLVIIIGGYKCSNTLISLAVIQIPQRQYSHKNHMT